MRGSVTFLAVCAALVVYFGYFALYGSHGIVNYVRLSHEVELRQSELATIQAERQTIDQLLNKNSRLK